MELFVARQPIFDSSKKIVAYELLHRESGQTSYTQSDGDYATSNVIASSFLTLGLDSLTTGKLAFINFSAELLLSGVATLLPKEQLVVEILGTVEPTQTVVEACRALKDAGYLLALDDFVLRPGYESLVDLADIIKVDFRLSTDAEQKDVIESVRNPHVRFLAERVETHREFRRAASLGYRLFQGYFFAKPTVIATGAVPINKIGYLQLLNALNGEAPNMKQIAAAIQSDVGLSLETVKLVNTALFKHKQRISNIPQAVVMLGLDGIRKWVYLTTLRRLGNTATPDVLINTSLIRAKFLEHFSRCMGLERHSGEFTLMGLFSLLDAITNHPFYQLLEHINLSDELKNVLVNEEYDSPLGQAYLLMLAYERGEWPVATKLCTRMGVSIENAAVAYIDALKWFYINYLAVA